MEPQYLHQPHMMEVLKFGNFNINQPFANFKYQIEKFNKFIGIQARNFYLL